MRSLIRTLSKTALASATEHGVGRFGKFATVGAFGGILNLSILYFLTTSGLHYLIAGGIAIESAFIFNFFGNKAWTFKDTNLHGFVEIGKALARDHAVRSFGMGLNIAILWILTDFLGVFYLISQAVGAAVAACWNFVGNVYWTWNR